MGARVAVVPGGAALLSRDGSALPDLGAGAAECARVLAVPVGAEV